MSIIILRGPVSYVVHAGSRANVTIRPDGSVELPVSGTIALPPGSFTVVEVSAAGLVLAEGKVYNLTYTQYGSVKARKHWRLVTIRDAWRRQIELIFEKAERTATYGGQTLRISPDSISAIAEVTE